MDKKQKMAIVILPLLAIALVAGGMFLKQQTASTPSTYVDGTYEGVGQGFNGDIKVAVTIANGEISNIELLEIDDTPGLGDNAANQIIEAAIAGKTADVEVVSGATKSSEGTIEAIKAALALASGGGAFADGTHEGVAQGFGGDIKVSVVVEGGKIINIEVLENSETAGLGDVAIDQITAAIIETQSLNVDMVSGATKSSEGTIAAVKNALGMGDSEEESEDATAEIVDIDLGALENGVYTASEEGFKGEIELSVEVQDGKIVKIDILNQSETEGLGDEAIDAVIAQVIDNQDVNADVVTGATYSSEAAKKAIIKALEGTPAPLEAAEAPEEVEEDEPASAEEPAPPSTPAANEPAATTPASEPAASGFKDGTYKASTNDSFYGEPINVTITISGGKITNVAVSENETPEIGGEGAKKVAAEIVKRQSADLKGSDVASGATVTADAVIQAAKSALSQAK